MLTRSNAPASGSVRGPRRYTSSTSTAPRGAGPSQLDLIERMANAVNVPLQVGGGIRTLEDLRAARRLARSAS